VQPTELSVIRVIRAPPEKVFAAWTDPLLLRQWWGPGAITCPEVHLDLREGGSYRIANLETDGSIVWISGTFERVRFPVELVYTWRIDTRADEVSLVRVNFLPHSEGTELRLTHERFATEAVRDMHLQGWNGCLDKLERLFTGSLL
jgi:uncharacterized protein YndB with AHSA1/START domain